MNRLSIELFGKELRNPIMPASGTYGYGEEYSRYYEPSELGALISKGITFNPKAGNDGIRIWETPSGILNSIGLENPGIHKFISDVLPKMKTLNENIIVNLGGNTIEDYVEGAKLLNDEDIFAIELNISCPNVKEGGMAFGIDSEQAALVTRLVKEVSRHKLIVKLSPNARDLVECAKKVEEAGADGLSLVNTFLGMAIDIDKVRIPFNNTYAGLSGPAIKPIALRMTHQVAHAVNIPVIAMGGITNYRDALEFIMAGATAVEIGTANFMNPMAVVEILDEMENYLEEKDTTIKEICKIL